MKIEKRNHHYYTKPETWDEISIFEYVSEGIDPEDERTGYGYDRDLGQIEKMERSVERVKGYCAYLTEVLIKNGLIDLADITERLGRDGYRFTETEASHE